MSKPTPCSPFPGLRQPGPGTYGGAAWGELLLRKVASRFFWAVMWVQKWIRGSFSSNPMSMVFSLLGLLLLLLLFPLSAFLFHIASIVGRVVIFC